MEPAVFSAALPINQKTAQAPDRQSPQLLIHPITLTPLEVTRNASAPFSLDLEAVPIIACLEMSVWHQGTDEKPEIQVNGARAGTLEPCFPGLSHRNYVFFKFPAPNGSQIIQTDYQGWLPARCFFEGKLLKKGMNQFSLSVKTDQIKIKDLQLEALYTLDDSDTVYDFTEPKP